MRIGPFRLGYRTFKTGIAVLLSIIVMRLFGQDNPMIACLTAVFTLREDLSSTYEFGRKRVLGVALGGISAILFYLSEEAIGNTRLAELILIPLFVIFLIVMVDSLGAHKGIIGGTATFLIIAFNTPKNQTLGFVIHRVLGSFVGMFIAFVVNRTIKAPPRQLVAVTPKDLHIAKLKNEVARQQKEIQQLQNVLENAQKKD